MANRHTLAVSQLEDFKSFLIANEYVIKEPKSYYEVLRAYHTGRRHPVIVYKRLASKGGFPLVHLSVTDRDIDLLYAYFRNRRKCNG